MPECKRCTSTEIEADGLCYDCHCETLVDKDERMDKFVFALSDALLSAGEQFGIPFQTKMDDGKRKLEFIGFNGSPCLEVVIDFGD